MDDFFLTIFADDRLRFITSARYVSSTGWALRSTSIVVTEFDQNEIAWFHGIDELSPSTFTSVGTKRPASNGSIDDLDAI